MGDSVAQTAERPASFEAGGALCCQARPRHEDFPTCLGPRQEDCYWRRFGRCSGFHAGLESRSNVGRRNADQGDGPISPNARRATDHTGRGRRRGLRYEGRMPGLTSQGGSLAIPPEEQDEKHPHTSSPVWLARSRALPLIARSRSLSFLRTLPSPQRGGGETVLCPASVEVFHG